MESLASFKSARNLARKTLAMAFKLNRYLLFFFFHWRLFLSTPPLSAVSMQDHGQADFRSKVFWIQAKILKCAGGAGKQNRIHGFLMIPGQ
jgi:hypothetical protein